MISFHLRVIVIMAAVFSISSLPSRLFSQDQTGDTNQGSVGYSGAFQGLVMTREGSGTGWAPEYSPMHAFGINAGTWNFMFHGNIFPRYLATDLSKGGQRGGSQLSMPNWIMLMLNKDLKDFGIFQFRTMFSFEALTEGGNGYSQLFQSGETWNNKTIIDHQHPHDLFSELSFSYSKALGNDGGLFAYFALPGEPAIGPTAAPHRASARNIPNTPLSHHWLDSTHVSFGVATIGFWYSLFKLDASLFNGTEPNENRYDLDAPKFDSYSIRLTAAPIRSAVLQLSYGYLKDAEILEPGTDIGRITASATYSIPIYDFIDFDYVNWDTTAAWGVNFHDGNPENALLFESDLQINSTSLYTRLELVEKSMSSLDLTETQGTEGLQSVTAFTFGSSQKVFSFPGFAYSSLALTIGADVTFHMIGKEFREVYGNLPVSAQVYLKISPDLMKMEGH